MKTKGPRWSRALDLRLAGATYSEIAAELGISRQRVQQMLEPPAGIRQIVSRRAKGKCESCGVSLLHGHVHHKQARGMEIDSYVAPDNLSYLCLSCHRHEHTGTKEPMTSVFVLRTERQMKEKLEQLARADGKDTSSYVRMIFEQYLSSRGSKAK